MFENFKKIEIESFLPCIDKIIDGLKKEITITGKDLDIAEKILNPELREYLSIPEPVIELINNHESTMWELKIAQLIGVLNIKKCQVEIIVAYFRLKFIRDSVREIVKDFPCLEDEITPEACIYTMEHDFPESWARDFNIEDETPFVSKFWYYCLKFYVKVTYNYEDQEPDIFYYRVFPASYYFMYYKLKKENGKFIDDFA